VIKSDRGVEVLFRQIAGAVARRIRWYIKPTDQVTQGNEMGFIKFGSRVDVFVPVGTDIQVAIGQKVTAAESLLGILK
jgi:phosphatidylserine decarboxylase